MDYHKKYLKYKIKYINLRNEIEGGSFILGNVKEKAKDFTKSMTKQVAENVKKTVGAVNTIPTAKDVYRKTKEAIAEHQIKQGDKKKLEIAKGKEKDEIMKLIDNEINIIKNEITTLIDSKVTSIFDVVNKQFSDSSYHKNDEIKILITNELNKLKKKFK